MQNLICFANVGYSPTPRQHFEKLLDQKTFSCLRLVIGNTTLRKNNLSRPAKGGSTPAFTCQRAAIAPLPCLNLQLVSYKS